MLECKLLSRELNYSDRIVVSPFQYLNNLSIEQVETKNQINTMDLINSEIHSLEKWINIPEFQLIAKNRLKVMEQLLDFLTEFSEMEFK